MAVRVIDTDVWSYLYKASDEAKLYEPHLFGNILVISFQTQAEADGKLVRAKLSSTQLPTYFLGTRQWWMLRKKYQAAKGRAFTLEEFHDRALDQGPLPIEYLSRAIARNSTGQRKTGQPLRS